jgi:hypothetical protein
MRRGDGNRSRSVLKGRLRLDIHLAGSLSGRYSLTSSHFPKPEEEPWTNCTAALTCMPTTVWWSCWMNRIRQRLPNELEQILQALSPFSPNSRAWSSSPPTTGIGSSMDPWTVFVVLMLAPDFPIKSQTDSGLVSTPESVSSIVGNPLHAEEQNFQNRFITGKRTGF